MSHTPSLKVVVVGNASVGKSSMVQRLVQGSFVTNPSPTCGADFYLYSFNIDDEEINFQIWDTAGQERFKSISKSYFRFAVGAILVYDISNLHSFDELSGWLDEFQSLASPNAYILLVGNKSDLEEQRQVGVNQVQKFAQDHQLSSALTGKNIVEAFTRLAYEVNARVKSGQITIQPRPGLNKKAAKENSQCC